MILCLEPHKNWKPAEIAAADYRLGGYVTVERYTKEIPEMFAQALKYGGNAKKEKSKR